MKFFKTAFMLLVAFLIGAVMMRWWDMHHGSFAVQSERIGGDTSSVWLL